MKILNLTNKETSDIKFEVSSFPDGQQNIVITGPTPKIGTYDINWQNVHIKSRLNNFKDLELIICATKSLRELGVKKIHLYTPYFMGARSDRKFQEGGNNYLKDVICPIINSLNFESVTVMDPHSHILEACLNNFRSIDNLRLVKFALNDISTDNAVIVSPDAGSLKKIYKLADQLEIPNSDIITCSKERDVNGKLTKCVVPFIDAPNKDFIIIDDILDAGGTFINIAQVIKNNIIDRYEGKGKIYLVVTHGIFSKGVSELNKYFDGIYTTNSYKDQKRPEFETKKEQELVNQLNVF